MAFLASCIKEKPPLLSTEDICTREKPIEASFWIGESASKLHLVKPCGPWEPNLDGDTIIPTDHGVFYGGGQLYFTANAECYDELEWIIGSDPTHLYGKQIYVEFSADAVAGTSLPITLIAKKKPNLLCYPSDDGVDTLTRTITFLNQNREIFGYFEGYNIGEDPNDTFTVWIKDHTDLMIPMNEDIVGLPRGCNYNCNGYPYSYLFYLTERKMSFCGKNSVNGAFWDCPGTGVCPSMHGIVDYSADFDTVTISYSYANNPLQTNDGANSIKKVFVGVRQ